MRSSIYCLESLPVHPPPTYPPTQPRASTRHLLCVALIPQLLAGLCFYVDRLQNLAFNTIFLKGPDSPSR